MNVFIFASFYVPRPNPLNKDKPFSLLSVRKDRSTVRAYGAR